MYSVLLNSCFFLFENVLNQFVGTEASYKLTERTGNLFSCPASESLAHCISADVRMGKGIAVSFKTKFGGVDELKSQGTFNIVIYFNLSIFTDSSIILSVIQWLGINLYLGLKMYRPVSSLPLITTLQIIQALISAVTTIFLSLLPSLPFPDKHK